MAHQALFERRVFGILEIPPDTEREVLKGNQARIPAYVDSAYFLVFNRTLQGIAEGAGDINLTDISRGLRMDGAQIGSVNIAQGKARTSARFRRPTQIFYNVFEGGHPYLSTLDPGLVASPGGFPLIENGKLIGAIGCSGGTGDQDAAICKVGADLIK